MLTVFAYRAAMPNGEVATGVIDADSTTHAREMLSSRRLYLLSLESRGQRMQRREPLSVADLALGLRILADLLDSGLSLPRALQVFEELAPRDWRPALPAIRETIREGRSLATALAAAPIEIPPLVIGIAQAGEAGQGSGPAIRRAAELMEASAETRAAVRAALAYPVVVALAGALAVSVLATVVLPRFARILADLGQQLPTSTRAVLAASEWSRSMLVPATVASIVACVAWRTWTSTATGRRSWHRVLLRVPVVGAIRIATASARAAHSLAALLESGVTMSSALVHAARAAADAEVEARMLAARAAVSVGDTLSHALQRHRASTPTVFRLTRAGEESGRLSSMLQHAARIEQQRADRTVRAMVRMLEPTLLLVFASAVALIAAALLQAIYSVRPTA